MRPHSAIISLSLALLSTSTSAAAGRTLLGWRLWNPSAGTAKSSGASTLAAYKDGMAAQGYTLVSSTTNDGLTIAFWSPTNGATKRSALTPEDLPGARRDLSHELGKRNPAPVPVAQAEAQELSTRDDVPLVKRATDIGGWRCDTECAFQNFQKADTNDCVSAYQKMYSLSGQDFTLTAGQALSATSDQENCSIWVVNRSSQEITYDYRDAAGTGQWLNWGCLITQSATVGVCTYQGIGTNVTNGVWTAVCHPSFMTSAQTP